MIAIQEAYLSTNYNPLYWACAVLTSNSGSIHEEEEECNEEGEEDVIKKVITNYDKVARGIGDLTNHGIKVSPPYINKANFSFTPDIKGNQIIYSLKAISGVSDETADLIVRERKIRLFSSLEDFMTRINPKKVEIISLIKSGAFDEFNKNRIDMMTSYIKSIVGVKSSLNGQNLDFMVKNELIPDTLGIYKRYHNYKKYIFNKKFFHSIDEDTIKNKTPKKWFVLDNVGESFFNQQFIHLCQEGKHYRYLDNGNVIVKDKDLQDTIKKAMNPLYDWLISKEAVEEHNQLTFKTEWDKYCKGNISKWEMDSLCYYYHEHELQHVDREVYGIRDFNELPSEPKKIGEYKYRKQVYPINELSMIVGSCIGTNNTKHIVTLLTTNGVVDVKMYGGAYSFYNKQISRVNSDGSKTVIEKSWFKRGEKLMLYGFRRDNVFVPKKYSNSIVQHTLQRIIEIKENGELVLQNERKTL